jgi:hypothetical protein
VSRVDRQLHDLLDVAAGEPPHRISVQAVRRRTARRRVLAGIAAATAVVLIVGIGIAVSAGLTGGTPQRGAGPLASRLAGPPRYYLEQPVGDVLVVRATATGAVTATVPSPWRQSHIAIGEIAAVGQQTFFIVCVKGTGQDPATTSAAERIYRFQVTDSGRVSGFSPVRGGAFDGLVITGIAAAPDGSQIAVTVVPSDTTPAARPPAREKLIVINTRTGARAVWQRGTVQASFAVTALSWVGDGRELEFLARCVHPHLKNAPCEATDMQVGTIDPEAGGGRLEGRRLVLRQAGGYINDIVISSGGTALTAALLHSAPGLRSASASVSVDQFSAVTGRRLHVLYRARTGNGFLYRFLNSDPSGRYLLLDVGPTRGAVNGWIDHGRLVRLKPAGSGVFYEAW